MRPHNVTGWRRTDPRWSPEKCESNHQNSATSHRQTHEENKLLTRPTPCWSPSGPSCIIAALFTVPLTSLRGLFLPATTDNRKQVRSLSTGKRLVKSKAELVDLLLSLLLSSLRCCFEWRLGLFVRAMRRISCEIPHNFEKTKQVQCFGWYKTADAEGRPCASPS